MPLPQNAGVFLALFAVDKCLYCADRKEGYVLRKLQRGLSSMDSWCERSGIKIDEDKTWAMCFSRSLKPVDACLTLNGREILFTNEVKYFGVFFDRKVTWRLHTNARSQGFQNIS